MLGLPLLIPAVDMETDAMVLDVVLGTSGQAWGATKRWLGVGE